MCDLLAPKANALLADGWSALVYGLIGDHDYKRDCLLLTSVNSAQPCSHCNANKTNLRWFDFSLGAKWITSPRSGDFKCSLFGTDVGISRKSVWPDWMHDKYLGTDKVPGERNLRFCMLLRCVLMFPRFMFSDLLRAPICFYITFPMNALLKVLYGSVMQLLVNESMPSSPEENLKVVWKEIKDQYKAQKITSRFGNMKMTMFNPKGGTLFCIKSLIHLRV